MATASAASADNMAEAATPAIRALDFPDAGAVAVFGGSGGAGSAICRAFAAAGCAVAFTYHSNATKARELEQELGAQGGKARAFQLNLADAKRTRDVVDEIREAFGGIHTVVYSAGPRIDLMNICDVSSEGFTDVISAELVGFFNIVHAAMPILRKSAGSVVACVTSANRFVMPSDGLSAVPKAGIESLLRQIAFEEAPHGVRANGVGLGWLNLGLGEIGNSERSLLKGELGQQVVAHFAAKIPLGHRPGSGQDLANAVLFMASKQAGYITGQCVMVDGGMSL